MWLRHLLTRNVVQSTYSIISVKSRTFKNFGHKREPIPTVTTLWHGFLTFTLIGLGLNWDWVSNFMFGGNEYDEVFHDSLKSKNNNRDQVP